MDISTLISELSESTPLTQKWGWMQGWRYIFQTDMGMDIGVSIPNPIHCHPYSRLYLQTIRIIQTLFKDFLDFFLNMGHVNLLANTHTQVEKPKLGSWPELKKLKQDLPFQNRHQHTMKLYINKYNNSMNNNHQHIRNSKKQAQEPFYRYHIV